MNGKPLAFDGRRDYAMLPAGPIRRTRLVAEVRLTPERVRELMVGCYPEPRTDKRLAKGMQRAARAAKLLCRLGTVRAVAHCLRMSEKATYRLLSFYGFDIKALRREAA